MTANRTALRRRLALSTALCVAAFAAAPGTAQNMPGFGTINSTSGNPTVAVDNNVLDVSAGNNAIINWQNFDVPKEHTANYHHRDGDSAPNIAILNRVQGGNFTNILGNLNSDKNVSVYIINPNGIVFGENAQVNVGALVASTLSLAGNDDAFLDGSSSLRFQSGSGSSVGVVVGRDVVINTGKGGDLGDLVLLGNFISSNGTLVAEGDIGFVAGEDITVKSSNNSPLAFTVARGSTVANAITLSNNITGQTVFAKFLSQVGVANAILSVEAGTVITATSAVNHSRGVSLEASDVNAPVSERGLVDLHIGQSAKIRAVSADVSLYSNGDLTLLGDSVSHRFNALANGDIKLGNINSGYGLSIRAQGDIDVSDIVNDGYVQIISHGDGDINLRGDITAIKLNPVGGLDVGQIHIEGGNINFFGGEFRSNSSVRIEAANSITGSGKITSGVTGGDESVTIVAIQGINAAGLNIQSGASGKSAISFIGPADKNIILGDIKAGSLTGLSNRQGDITLGNVDIAGDVILKGLTVDTKNISSGGAVSLTGYTKVGNIEAAGDIDISSPAVVYTGNLQSSGGGISITANDAITVGNLSSAKDIALTGMAVGGSDNIRIGGADAGQNLKVSLAGRGDVEIGGNIKAGGNVDISSGGDVKMADGTSIAANETSGNIKIFGHYGADLRSLSARDISLASDPGGEIYLRGDVKAATLDLQGGNVEQTGGGIITVGKLTGRDLDSVELTNANRISEIGDFATNGLMSIRNMGGGLIVSGAITNASQISIKTDGTLTLNAGSKISGDLVILGGNRFINNAGSSAVTASGRWFIETDAPDGNVYGGLNSDNTAIWDVDNSNGTPTGNRYGFRYQPTLTFTSTDYAKTYGDDIAALLAGHYTVSGLHAGVAGAFLGDTLADVISGSPLLTSLGATARASVAGGPYVIEIGQGSLTSLSGYKFAFNNAGRVTVGKKALTATVGVDNKTYDGNDKATGKFTSLNGLVQDDVVEVGGTLKFASKNAGTQKVSVENLGLAGADAGNYTVTISVPDQLSATIFKKAVSVQVAVDDKTYDGTTKANGRITGIDGKIAGDDLNATGGSYTYGDKNAGGDKLVTVSNIVIGGADAGNYEVTIPVSVLADILKKAVTVNISADSKTYDQTTAATGRINGIEGVIAGDDVKATGGSYAFADKNAGKGKTVSVSGIQLSGGDLGNYDVTIPATVLAEILKRAVTITISVDGKTYDGTTDATGRITGMEGVLSGDQLTVTGGKFAFLDKNAGAGKAATANGFTYGGADAGNYEAVIAPGAMADIAKRAITVRANDATGYVFSPSTNLTYAVTQGSLAPGDAFTGALAREPGYVPGDYAIGLGTLSLSSNYDMTFEAGTFTLALGTPPLRQQVPDLYRSFELGGRAQAMRREPRALIWAQAFDCQSSTRNAELCQ